MSAVPKHLDVRAAAKLCGVPDYTFRVRQRDGWPEMKGQRLPSKPESTGHGGLTRYLFAEEDVKRLGALLQQSNGLAPGWHDEETFRDVDGWTGLTELGAHKRFKMPRRTVRRWPEGCRFLEEGRAIDHRNVTPAKPRASKDVRVYSLADLQAIAAQYRRKSVRKTYHDDEGRLWLTAAQIAKSFQVSLSFARMWARKNSRLRPGGKALRCQSVPNAVRHKKGSPATVLVYLQEDVERILRQEETKYPGSGTPSHPPKTFEDRERHAREFLQTFLQGGPRLTPDVIREGRKERLYMVRLYRAAKKLGVTCRGERGHNVPLWWCLPGQQPPAEIPAARAQSKGGSSFENTAESRRGRKRSARTLELGKFCYEQLAREVKRRTICKMIQERYGRIMAEPDVTIYARRYAKDNGQSWPL